jgi:hypothetical protein
LAVVTKGGVSTCFTITKLGKKKGMMDILALLHMKLMLMIITTCCSSCSFISIVVDEVITSALKF